MFLLCRLCSDVSFIIPVCLFVCLWRFTDYCHFVSLVVQKHTSHRACPHPLNPKSILLAQNSVNEQESPPIGGRECVKRYACRSKVIFSLLLVTITCSKTPPFAHAPTFTSPVDFLYTQYIYLALFCIIHPSYRQTGGHRSYSIKRLNPCSTMSTFWKSVVKLSRDYKLECPLRST